MTQKIIIIGAGVIGASMAYYLSKQSAEVTVLEKNHIASEASGSSFGWLNANFPESTDYFNLRQASLEEYSCLLSELPQNLESQFNGCLFWELQGEKLVKHYEALKVLNYSVELVGKDGFQQLEPNMANIPPLAMKAEKEGAVDAEKLTKTLLNQSKVNAIEQCQMIDFIQKNDQVMGVETNQGKYFADTTIIAAGISAGQLLTKLNFNLLMKNRKGFIIKTKPTQRFINRVLFGNDIHFKQENNGSVVIGDWLRDIEGKVDLEAIAQRTISRFASHFPEQKKIEIDKIIAAYRPMPEDGYSVIGQPENRPGLYIASTHSGVTLAPIIGKLAAQEILENQNSELLNSFRIERFQ